MNHFKQLINPIFESFLNCQLTAECLFSLLKWHNERLLKGDIDELWVSENILNCPGLTNTRGLGRFVSSPREAGCLLARGYGKNFFKVLLLGMIYRKPILLLEDGFVRSIYPFTANVEGKLKEGMSFTLDSQAFYFVGGRRSDLEDLLNTYELEPKEYVESQQLIKCLIDNRISKYNNQNIHLPNTNSIKNLRYKKNSKVLVIEQSYGDQSLRLGLAPENVFQTMMDDAIKENPNAMIYFKRHPDNINNHVQTQVHFDQNVFILDSENPLSILPYVDKVYVATSQLGLEALFFGKEVHVYGFPFYAGWGLTVDKISSFRRKRKLSLEELFYIVYVKYSRYAIDGVSCTLNDVIREILQLRAKHIKSGRDPNNSGQSL